MSFIHTPLVRGFEEIRNLFVMLGQDSYICGGYARWCASPKDNPIPPTDVDIFCKDMDTYKFNKESFDEFFKLANENDLSLTYDVESIRSHSIWRSFPFNLQLIKPNDEAKILTYGMVEDILANFDFTISRAAIISPTECLVDEDYLKDEKHTHLKFKNIHCPVSSMFRAIKYIKKGYWMSPVESIKLFLDWDKRDAEYRQKLIDFLEKAEEHNKTGEDTLSEQEMFEFERLMKID